MSRAKPIHFYLKSICLSVVSFLGMLLYFLRTHYACSIMIFQPLLSYAPHNHFREFMRKYSRTLLNITQFLSMFTVRPLDSRWIFQNSSIPLKWLNRSTQHFPGTQNAKLIWEQFQANFAQRRVSVNSWLITTVTLWIPHCN